MSADPRVQHPIHIAALSGHKPRLPTIHEASSFSSMMADATNAQQQQQQQPNQLPRSYFFSPREGGGSTTTSSSNQQSRWRQFRQQHQQQQQENQQHQEAYTRRAAAAFVHLFNMEQVLECQQAVCGATDQVLETTRESCRATNERCENNDILEMVESDSLEDIGEDDDSDKPGLNLFAEGELAQRA